jgi:serine/threonine-protein kinase HipA
MALKLNGKDDRLRRSDFMQLAATAGLSAAGAAAAINDLLQRFAGAVEQTSLPKLSDLDRDIQERAEMMIALAKDRVATFA